jgi:hypothetical protein
MEAKTLEPFQLNHRKINGIPDILTDLQLSQWGPAEGLLYVL